MRKQDYPLVSCILPTTGKRPAFVAQAEHYFESQTYPRRELLFESGRSTGANRNAAIERANGEIIMLWDDDDYYGPDRISYQVRPILDGTCDMTALSMDAVFDLTKWVAYQCITPGLFPGYVLGGTLAFRSRIASEVKYIDKSDGEDSYFLHRCVIAGARLAPMSMEDHYVYIRHPGTKAAFRPGTFFKSEAWRGVMPEETALQSDIEWYRSQHEKMAREEVVIAERKTADLGAFTRRNDDRIHEQKERR